MKKMRVISNKKGVTAVMVAVMMVMLFGLGALAIDLGHLYIVRNELQDAADAAALAGAAMLYSTGSSGPDWAAAEQEAVRAVKFIRSDGIAIADCDVVSGYWNLAHTPEGMQSQSITPGSMDAAAVRVKVTRSGGQNGGAVQNWLASMLGAATSNVSAAATAVSESTGSVSPGGIFPVAISKESADLQNAYNNAANTIKIASVYKAKSSIAGQWTSLNTDANDSATINDLIANGNPTALGAGDNIWIEPGVKNDIYSSVPTGTDVLLPVVDAVLSDSTHSEVPIYGFIGFHITQAVAPGIDSGTSSGTQKSDKSKDGGKSDDRYIEGYFTQYYARKGGAAGPTYGVYSPPKLVQ